MRLRIFSALQAAFARQRARAIRSPERGLVDRGRGLLD
jgi:hypothetical protein